MTVRPSAHDDVTADIRAEIDAHITARVEDNLARGLSLAEAEREARQRFGPIEAVEEHAVKIRRSPSRWHRLLPSDARQAWLSVSRRPLMTVCGVLVAAAGLMTAFASARVADAVLFRAPSGIGRPDELLSVLDSRNGERGTMMSIEAFRALQRDVPDAEPFVWGQRDFQVISDRDARVWQGEIVSGSYFAALQVRSGAGRLIGIADDDGHNAVAVVSHRLAATLGDTPLAAIGRRLRVNGQAFEIVGVAPARFQGVEAGSPSDLWIPMSSEPDVSTPSVFPDGHVVRGFINANEIGWLRGGIRLRPGQSREAIDSRMSASLRSRDKQPAPKHRAFVTDRPWQSPFSGNREAVISATTPILWAVAFTVFLTAVCLGSLFVGRLTDRQREFAVRLALGATRARVMRMALLEIVIVLALGTAAAVPGSEILLASAARLQLAQSMLVSDTVTAGIDLRAMGLLGAMVAVVAIVAMTGPVTLLLRMSRTSRIESTRATIAGHRLRRVLLAAQVGAGCALISGAVLLTQSIGALRAQPLGYDAAAVSFAVVDPAGAGLSDDERAALPRRLAATAWPAGARVGFADQVPYGGSSTLFLTGTNSATPQYPFVTSRVSANYFDILGIRIIEGRAFDERDMGQRVAILSDELAKVYWPNGHALGESVMVGGAKGVPHLVVGIAAGARDEGLKFRNGSRLYLPYGADAESLTVVARGGDTGAGDRVLTEAIHALDARLVVVRAGTLRDLAWKSVEQRILIRFVTATIGVGSLAMVSIGVWGLAHSSLRRRWREFGIRQALGATRGQISRLALGDALAVSAVGGALGLAGAWQLGRVLKSWLFGVGEHDPLALAIGLSVVVGAAMIGAALPARNAARINAANLLRDE
jgi:putative ABC transport system permease protein